MNSKGWVSQSQNTNGLGAEQERAPGVQRRQIPCRFEATGAGASVSSLAQPHESLSSSPSGVHGTPTLPLGLHAHCAPCHEARSSFSSP